MLYNMYKESWQPICTCGATKGNCFFWARPRGLHLSNHTAAKSNMLLQSPDTILRVVIATLAFFMRLDIPNVKKVNIRINIRKVKSLSSLCIATRADHKKEARAQLEVHFVGLWNPQTWQLCYLHSARTGKYC